MKSAIVGLGVIGSVHASILEGQKRAPVAVCDIEKERLEKYPSAEKYTDYVRMLEEVRPDAVHICTPHYLHADMIIEDLKRDINVLCEQPLCIRAGDLSRISDAERNSRGRLGVCHQNRYNEANIFVRDYLRGKEISGAYGTVVWNRDAEYYASGGWRGKRETEGGGVLINQALHTLDLLEWLVGEPHFVASNISNLTLSSVIETEDTAAAVFSGGAEFCFFATNGGAVDFPVQMTIRADGETITVLPETVIIDGKRRDFTKDTRRYGKCCYGTGHEKLFADFYDCLETGRKFPIDGAEGAKVVKLILACYRSKGKKVEI